MLMVRAVLCRAFSPAVQWKHINRIRGQKLFSHTKMPAQPVLIVSSFERRTTRSCRSPPEQLSFQSGAGPSGLVLALALRKNGVDVRIIDKEAGPRLGERGPGVSVSHRNFLYQRPLYVSQMLIKMYSLGL
jgi:hypothetical protein